MICWNAHCLVFKQQFISCTQMHTVTMGLAYCSTAHAQKRDVPVKTVLCSIKFYGNNVGNTLLTNDSIFKLGSKMSCPMFTVVFLIAYINSPIGMSRLTSIDTIVLLQMSGVVSHIDEDPHSFIPWQVFYTSSF